MIVGEGAMADKPVVGVDVAKGWLDMCVSGACERIDNTAAAVLSWLDRVRPGLVACEPTGGYERVLLDALRARAIPFVRVHPNQLVAFRQSQGMRAKTDRIDARLIYAFVCHRLSQRGLHTAIPGDPALAALAARRRQLVETLHAERCRLAMAHLNVLRDSHQDVIDSAIASISSRANSPRRSPTTRIPKNWPRCCRQSLASAPPSPPP
jgi:transposase